MVVQQAPFHVEQPSMNKYMNIQLKVAYFKNLLFSCFIRSYLYPVIPFRIRLSCVE